MSWTDDKVNKLKDLWGKGNTASQIAQIIGGVSRNAVIGKAHRLNLSATPYLRLIPTYCESPVTSTFLPLDDQKPGMLSIFPAQAPLMRT